MLGCFCTGNVASYWLSMIGFSGSKAQHSSLRRLLTFLPMPTSPWLCPKCNKRQHCATSVFTQWGYFWGSWKSVWVCLRLALKAIFFIFLCTVHLIPTNPVAEQRSHGKNRKRVNPVLHTEPPSPDPIRDTHQYCNYPNITEHGWEGEKHTPSHLLKDSHRLVWTYLCV